MTQVSRKTDEHNIIQRDVFCAKLRQDVRLILYPGIYSNILQHLTTSRKTLLSSTRKMAERNNRLWTEERKHRMLHLYIVRYTCTSSATPLHRPLHLYIVRYTDGPSKIGRVRWSQTTFVCSIGDHYNVSFISY